MKRFVNWLVVSVVCSTGLFAGAANATVKETPSSTFNYGPGPLQTDQVFPGGSTVVALIHGGGFKSTAHLAAQLQPEAKQLQRAGFTTVIINYDQGSITSEVSDVVAGAQAVGATTLIGGSSGGALAAYAADITGDRLISLSGDLNPAAALVYWAAQGTKLGKTHVANLTAAGVTRSTPPPVLNGTAYVYASANEEPIVVSNAESFGGTLTLVSGTKHAWDYWAAVFSQVAGEVA